MNKLKHLVVAFDDWFWESLENIPVWVVWVWLFIGSILIWYMALKLFF